jgi:fructose-1,6-bisphosphatase/inositol monophosphatase family enzyme
VRGSSISREAAAARDDLTRALVQQWREPLVALAGRLREVARTSLAGAVREDRMGAYARPVGRGAGDLTFDLDRACEEVLASWLEESARSSPISLLTEDRGWRHLGPGAQGVRALEGFDHGGPRVAIDPVDGTRNLMADLRPAWTVIGLCGPGAKQPTMSEVVLGVVSEIPDTRAARARLLTAALGQGARVASIDLSDGRMLEEVGLHTDEVAHIDHGYFPFFAYHPRIRPEIARVAAGFFERLEEHEGAALESCYDDQYISSGGQLALLALGTYRAVVEMRSLVARLADSPTQVAKPYDVTGALLCAREAGCVVARPDGSELDFPIDTSTPIDFAAWANSATAQRLAPHLAAVLAQEEERKARPGKPC